MLCLPCMVIMTLQLTVELSPSKQYHSLMPKTSRLLAKPRSYSENWAPQHCTHLRRSEKSHLSTVIYQKCLTQATKDNNLVSDLQNYRFGAHNVLRPMTSVRTYHITHRPLVPNLEWFDSPVEGLALVAKLHCKVAASHSLFSPFLTGALTCFDRALPAGVRSFDVSNTTKEAFLWLSTISEKD